MKYLQLKLPPLVWLALFMFIEHSIAQYTASEPASGLTLKLAYFMALAGLAVVVLGIAELVKAGTTISPINPDETTKLVTMGIFKLSRNPIYLGLEFILLAWALHLGSLFAVFIALLFIPCITRFQIIPEEEELQARFKSEYTLYISKVRRWL